MFQKVMPEQVGVSSSDIRKYVQYLESKKLVTHSMVIMRHDKVIYENYWKPFNKDFKHRLYSDSKSYVALGIGFLVQEGLVNLDAPIVSYFDEEITKNASPLMKKQTVKEMLTMSTSYPLDKGFWFEYHYPDRLKAYFETSGSGKQNKGSGMLYDYDSWGSFVLCALIEVVTGKKFVDFMHEKLFSKIGVAADTYALTCPGGHTWGDSAMLVNAMDQAKVILFTMKNGNWNGEQILDADYVKAATSKQVDNCSNGMYETSPNTFGYGYQIWRTRDNGFFFNGMGSQFAVAVPDKDMVFVINSDNQGYEAPLTVIIDGFFEMIANKVDSDTLPEDKKAYDELICYSEGLELFYQRGPFQMEIAQKINGVEYAMQENPMGITKVKFTFNGDEGVFEYTNKQGDKKLPFGIGKNVFGKFPEEGYSDLLGNTFEPGNYYDCAASARLEGNRISIDVQIIDKYFGRAFMNFGFKGDEISIIMEKICEDFCNEYQGWAYGKKA